MQKLVLNISLVNGNHCNGCGMLRYLEDKSPYCYHFTELFQKVDGLKVIRPDLCKLCNVVEHTYPNEKGGN